jgi:excisionase family DNA binding protein
MSDERIRIEKRDAPMDRWQRRLTSSRHVRSRSTELPARPPSERLRTVAEAADELGLSVYTVRAWIASRRIAHVRLGRTIRITAGEIRRIIEAGTVPAERT